MLKMAYEKAKATIKLITDSHPQGNFQEVLLFFFIRLIFKGRSIIAALNLSQI